MPIPAKQREFYVPRFFFRFFFSVFSVFFFCFFFFFFFLFLLFCCSHKKQKKKQRQKNSQKERQTKRKKTRKNRKKSKIFRQSTDSAIYLPLHDKSRFRCLQRYISREKTIFRGKNFNKDQPLNLHLLYVDLYLFRWYFYLDLEITDIKISLFF